MERAFFTAALDAREAERKAAARATRRGRIWITSLSAVLIVALVAGLVPLLIFWVERKVTQKYRADMGEPVAG